MGPIYDYQGTNRPYLPLGEPRRGTVKYYTSVTL